MLFCTSITESIIMKIATKISAFKEKEYIKISHENHAFKAKGGQN